MSLWRCAAGFLVAHAVLAAAPAPAVRFAGFFCEAGEVFVCLEEPASGAWCWTSTGGRFLDYRVVACDAAARTVTLSRAGQLHVIPLAGRGDTPKPDPSPPAAVAAIRDNLRRLFVAATLYRRESRERYVTFDDLVGPDKLVENLVPVAGEDYRGLAFMKGEAIELTVKTADGQSIGYTCPAALPAH